MLNSNLIMIGPKEAVCFAGKREGWQVIPVGPAHRLVRCQSEFVESSQGQSPGVISESDEFLEKSCGRAWAEEDSDDRGIHKVLNPLYALLACGKSFFNALVTHGALALMSLQVALKLRLFDFHFHFFAPQVRLGP